MSNPGEDHPRSRGVYVTDGAANFFEQGSSPLARGLHMDRADAPSRIRIIPARAGFTATPYESAYFTMDHPRSRGVYRLRTRMREIMPGSSPLARGLQLLSYNGVFNMGIIPARAGFTLP